MSVSQKVVPPSDSDKVSIPFFFFEITVVYKVTSEISNSRLKADRHSMGSCKNLDQCRYNCLD